MLGFCLVNIKKLFSQQALKIVSRNQDPANGEGVEIGINISGQVTGTWMAATGIRMTESMVFNL